MNINELYDRYINAYQIEIREISTREGRELLKELDFLEDLTIEQFKEKLNDKNFNERWGDLPNNPHNFMYNWIRSKSGK